MRQAVAGVEPMSFEFQVQTPCPMYRYAVDSWCCVRWLCYLAALYQAGTVG